MVSRRCYLLRAVHYVILVAVLAVMVFPLVWMFRVSMTPTGTALTLESLVTAGYTILAYSDLFESAGMGRYLFNSMFVGITVTAGNILFCFMVAYVLARNRNLGSRVLFGSVIIVLMIPAHVTIIPLYVLCFKAGIYDSYWALILPWLVNPLGIFLVKQYIESIPPSMEEAARIDGAGEFTILFRIVMPMCKPALAILAIQVFFTNWNSFLFPFILTSSDELRTLPVALSLLQGHQAIDWQHLMAGSSIAVIPVMIMFVILQRQIVSGITAGALKQ